MVATIAARTGPHPGLMTWLVGHAIPFELHEHRLTFTARETARAEGVDARTFAKVVGVSTRDGRNALVVLDAVDHVDMRKLSEVLETPRVRLLSEDELTLLAPECEAGALPAVGELFGLPMFADYAVRDDPAISFNAGNHSVSVRVERAAWEEATGVRYADLATAFDRRPAWTYS